jgi:hypothetical protein
MRSCACLLLALAVAPSAYAQFELLVLENGQERPAPSVYNLGSFYPDETATAPFRLRNTSAASATLSLLTVAGFGFVLSSPALPAGLPTLESIDFSVTFRAADPGAYSASLNANGISILLTTSVLPRLTYRVDPSVGPLQTGAFPGPLDFGGVLRGSSAQLRIRFQNQSTQALTVPSIVTGGGEFILSSPPPAGQIVQPGQGGEFTLAFTPTTPGVRQGTLTLGDRTYPLTGTCLDPTPPKPTISIEMPQVASAQQGTMMVRFDAPAQTAGSGTVRISCAGPMDSAIVFASGGREVAFKFERGDRQLSFAFQTGTTAGALTFTVAMDGGATDQQTVEIPAAAPAITGLQTVRSGGVLELRITGFDNTRSLGALAFTFYDAAGNVIAPGVIRADASAEFARYFATSEGGVFLLRLAFPVLGDTSGIAWGEAVLTNSAGSTKTARTAF